MRGNDLLFWLSHLGNGTWQSFRDAIYELADDTEREGEDFPRLSKQIRYRLSDIGCVDFFPEKRQKWRVVDPVLVSFSASPNKGILCGGRSPALIDEMERSARESGCQLLVSQRPGLPDQLSVQGELTALTNLAASCRIGRSASYAEELIRQFVPIEDRLRDAPLAKLMINWKRRYFDLDKLQWTESSISRTACECISQYGKRITFLQTSRTRTISLPRRDAIYAAAALAGKKIIEYESTSKVLKVPMYAPLPEPCARLVCVSGENVGQLDVPKIVYGSVSPDIACLIMTSLGQC